MNDNKRKSIERSIELHNKGQEFIEKRNEIPIGLKEPYIHQYTALKEKILRIKNSGEEDWNNWNWQLNNRIDSIELLEQLIDLTDKEKQEIKKISEKYRWAMTPYYAALMEPKSDTDIIRMMSVPDKNELCNVGVEDPTGEEFSNPAGIITRRYPDRLILNVTNSCPSFCRHCQRRRNISQQDTMAPWEQIEESIQYVADNTEIRDVLITGGDPFTLSDEILEKIIARVRRIKHVEIIRIGTRTLVSMPQRITPGLVNTLKKYHPIFINTQFNHPREITPESAVACTLLRDNGFMLGNQMVLLKGINDDKYVVRLLNHEMLKIGVRPYYIFHAKDVIGTLHFQTPIETGIEIIADLQGNTSGLAIPTYILSAPNGLGKIPLHPNYIVQNTADSIQLRTWEGRTVTIHHHKIPSE